MKTFSIRNSLVRKAEFYGKNDKIIPPGLFSVKNEAPSLDGIKLALPAAKKDYFCFSEADGVIWMGAPDGITRYAPGAFFEEDRVMLFSAPADLTDNNIKSIYAENADLLWAETEKSVARIELQYISAEEKAEILTEETEKYVSRRGMVTDRWLAQERKLSSVYPYGSSDNSGCFTAAYGIGKLFKYAVYKEKYGADSEKTKEAFESAVETCEACQLLMYIPSRGDGFVARDYQLPSEPVPSDSIQFRKNGDKSLVLDTSFAREHGYAGQEFSSPVKVPPRLSRLYEKEGCDGENIVYRGDTSSDEITIHLMLIYFAHKIIGQEDKELDEIMVNAMKNTVGHIIDHGYKLCDFSGSPTTWARWDREYFSTPLGWSDACLNAAELLMYLKMCMAVTGEKGRWLEEYNHLINDEGYAELTSRHGARFYISASAGGLDEEEDLMYGDNMLAAAAYWILISLEDDEKLKNIYKDGLRSWNGTFRREHNPAYDFMYMLSCPEDEDIIDTRRLEEWFRRQRTSRLMAVCGMELRHDVPVRHRTGGGIETGRLLPPDEFVASKYDRNPFEYISGNPGYNLRVIESAYPYTYAYWLGRYAGIIKED